MSIEFTVPDEVRTVYRRRARSYDFTANLFYLVGFREWAYRRRAVDALGLQPGDTVVEIGCGTGLNFNLIQKKIGDAGKIIGVDLTDAMLTEAKGRVEKRGWKNVELVETAAADFTFPAEIDGILSTFALIFEPEFDAVVQRGAKALTSGRRWVLLDIRIPSNWVRHLAPILIRLVRPFAVSEKVARRRPWKAIQRHLKNVSITTMYFGIAYLAVGEK